MKYAKYAKYAIVLSMFVLGWISTAFSQDATMPLEDPALGTHQRPLVIFPHEEHSAVIECQRCHHDFDANGNNLGGEGQACSECHAKTATGGLLPLKQAFHVQCIGCHSKLLAQGKKTGPITCGECHKRQQP